MDTLDRIEETPEPVVFAETLTEVSGAHSLPKRPEDAAEFADRVAEVSRHAEVSLGSLSFQDDQVEEDVTYEALDLETIVAQAATSSRSSDWGVLAAKPQAASSSSNKWIALTAGAVVLCGLVVITLWRLGADGADASGPSANQLAATSTSAPSSQGNASASVAPATMAAPDMATENGTADPAAVPTQVKVPTKPSSSARAANDDEPSATAQPGLDSEAAETGDDSSDDSSDDSDGDSDVDSANADDTGADPEAELVAAAAAPAQPGEKTLDELLDEGAGADLVKAKERVAPSKTKLTRDDIKATMGKARRRFLNCATRAGSNGTATLRFTVQPSGKVSKAAVTGRLAGTEFATCAVPVVKKLRFESYSGTPSSFTYPVLLNL